MMDDLIKKAWEVQTNIEKKFKRIGKGKYGRVFKMARHPEPDEYIRTAEISAIGIFIIGFIGFVIMLLATRFAPWLVKVLGI